MGSLFGSSSPSTDYTAQTKAAALSRAQYQDYLTRFQPIEDQIIASVFRGEAGPLPTINLDNMSSYQQNGLTDILAGVRKNYLDSTRTVANPDYDPTEGDAANQASQYIAPTEEFSQDRLDQLIQEATDSYIKGLNEEQAGQTRYQMNVEPTEEINEAMDLSRQQFKTNREMMGRTAERFGLDLRGDRGRVLARRFNNEGTLAAVNAANTTRQAVEDRDLGLAKGLIDSGRGLASDSMGTFGSTASMESARNAQNEAIASQNKAAETQGLMGLAGLGIAAYSAL